MCHAVGQFYEDVCQTVQMYKSWMDISVSTQQEKVSSESNL